MTATLPADTADTAEPSPTLAAGVEVLPTLADDRDADADGSADQWYLRRPDGTYFRVGRDVARAAELMDGTRSAGTIVSELGHPWTHERVTWVHQRLSEHGLVGDADATPRRRGRRSRFHYAPPLSLQFAVWRPKRVRPAIHGIVRRISWPVVAAICSTVVAGGVAAALTSADRVAGVVTHPQPTAVLVALAITTTVFTVLHELAHAGALVKLGGRPSRLGVMLFYAMPAFFCDVSDGWRLSQRRSRVIVAMAGIVAQLTLAGASMVASTVAPAGQVSDALVLVAIATFVSALTNLVPFVKLDGYIALMSHLDWPNLRRDAMRSWRTVLARGLYGSKVPKPVGQPAWVPIFGLACALFPVYLLVQATHLWLGIALLFGPIGSLIVLTVAGLIVFGTVRGVRRLVRIGRTAAVSRTRLLIGTSALLAALVPIVFVPVNLTITAGFYVGDDGTPRLVLPPGGDQHFVAGTPITVRTNGLLAGSTIATGVVDADAPAPNRGPVGAVASIDTGQDMQFDSTVSVTLDDVPDAEVGRATVDTGTVRLHEWIVQKYLRPALKGL